MSGGESLQFICWSKILSGVISFFVNEDHCLAYWQETRSEFVINRKHALQIHTHIHAQARTHGSHILEDSCRGVEALGKWIMESGQSTSSVADTCLSVSAADNTK